MGARSTPWPPASPITRTLSAASLLLSSFAFDSSIAGLFGTLAQGGCLRLCSEIEQKDAERLAEIIREESITHLLAPPSSTTCCCTGSPASPSP